MILQESLGWPNPLQHNSRSHHLSVISCSGHWCLSDREWLRTQATSSEEWKLSTCRWSAPTELCERGVRFVGLCPIRLALKCTDWKYWTIRPSNRILFLQDSSQNTSRIQGFGSSRPSQEKNIIATAAVEGCGTKAISDIHRYSAYWWLRECEFRLDDLEYEILHKSVGRQTGADRWQPSGQ